MSHILELRKFVVPEFVFGAQARKLVGRYAQSLRMQNILLVSDVGLQKQRWLSETEALLRESGALVMNYLHISPNPRDHEIMSGARLFMDSHCDGIVALGGGSVIDAAKGIGIVASNGGSILDYEGVDKIARPMPPHIAIPTTAGTAADISQFAIINDTSRQVKIAIVSKSSIPDVALVDPETLCSMDPVLTACTGMDALTHAIEAYVSNAASPITDGHALHAIGLVWKFLKRSVEAPLDLEARGEMMLASLTAGMAFSNASLGCVHAMAHSLGGLLDLPHGECNALLLPHVMRYNYGHAPERFDQIAHTFGLPLEGLGSQQRCEQVAQAVEGLGQSIGLDWTLGSRGLTRDLIPRLSSTAIHDPCNATNPRRPSEGDLAVLFSEAL